MAPPGERILVLEDTPIHQKVTMAQLQHLGYECDLVTNSQDLLTALLTGSYRALLMDIHLPRMDAHEMTRVIREFEKTQTAPWKSPLLIIALTGRTTPEDEEKGLAVGINTHLTRPVPHVKLQTELNRMIPR